MFGCECCISDKSLHSSLLTWRDRYLEKLKDKIQNSQSRKSSEEAHHIYGTYKNKVMSHGCHISVKSYDMVKATMYTYPKSDHAIPHWKFIFWCCDKCPCINLPDQETDRNMRK